MLKHYWVDLRKYTFVERKELYKRLDDFAFTCDPFLDYIGLYDVFWDLPESIENVLKIPSKCVLAKN